MLIVCPSCDSRYEIDEAKIGPSGRKVRCASCQKLWLVEPPAQEQASQEAASQEQATQEETPQEEASQEQASQETPPEDGLPPTEAEGFPPAPDEAEIAALLAQELQQAAEIDASLAMVMAERTATPGDPPATEAPRKRRKLKPAGAAVGGVRFSASKIQLACALAGVALLGIGLWQRDRVVRAAPQFAGLYEKIGLPVNIRGLTFSAVESDLVQDPQGRFLVVEGDVTNVTRSPAKVPPIAVSVRDAGGQVLYTWTTQSPRPTLEPSELVRFRARLAAPPAEGRSVQVRFASDSPVDAASLR